MVDLNELLSLPVFSNSLMVWLIAIAVAAAAFTLLLVVRRTVYPAAPRAPECLRRAAAVAAG
jgi:hypothetical protein